MQETKRRSKRGLLLLALVVALAVMAIVPASALAAPQQLKPVIDWSNYAYFGQGNTWWFNSGDVDGDYTFWLDGVNVGTTNIASVVFKVDGAPANGVVRGPVLGVPFAVDFNYAGEYGEGLHTVHSWVVEAVPNVLIEKPIVADKFGVDTVGPDWVHVVATVDGSPLPPTGSYTVGDKFYNLDRVDFSATVHDPAGSGVDATPTASVPADAAVFYANRLPYTDYTWEITGTVLSPTSTATPPYTPVTKMIDFDAQDMVGNVGQEFFHVNFDRVAPHTSYTITPAGADHESGWTNQDVTLKFASADGLPTPNSGVAYTEYVVIPGQSHAVPAAPALTASGTKGTEVTITETAPIGPVYVYYRSVDSAIPTPNYEPWNLVMVYIDKVPPTLTDDYPGWWMNTDFTVKIMAADHNSDIAPPGIEYKINPAVMGHPSEWTVGGLYSFNVMFGALTDGIWKLSYRASDRAGNQTVVDPELKVDTRAPVTDGASGWINGLEPYVLTATDQVPGAGVAATVWRVDQVTPWSFALFSPVAPVATTNVPINGAHGSTHTVDFASVDDARPFGWTPADGPHFGNWEINPPTFWAPIDDQRINLIGWTAYKSRTVKLDKVAPTVALANPVNPNWQKGPAAINFVGADDGSGYAYTEWSTDGGATWKQGETALIGGDGVITVHYRGVDKVGLKSAVQMTTVKVATTGPTVAAKNASVKKGGKATIKFKVNAVTEKASVNILIRKNGKTLMLKRYSMVTTNTWVSRSFTVNLPKGTYLIRVDATDQAGNVQTQRGQANLTVK